MNASILSASSPRSARSSIPSAPASLRAAASIWLISFESSSERRIRYMKYRSVASGWPSTPPNRATAIPARARSASGSPRRIASMICIRRSPAARAVVVGCGPVQAGRDLTPSLAVAAVLSAPSWTGAPGAGSDRETEVEQEIERPEMRRSPTRWSRARLSAPVGPRWRLSGAPGRRRSAPMPRSRSRRPEDLQQGPAAGAAGRLRPR